MVERNYHFSFLSCLTGQHCPLHMSHPNWSSLLFQPLRFCALPHTFAITTTLSNLLSVPQKTLRNVQIYVEVGKDTFGDGTKPFWGSSKSCLPLAQSRMAAAYTRNSRGTEATASLLPFSPRQQPQGITDTLLRGLSARPETESHFTSHQGWMRNETYRKNSMLSQETQER